MKDRVALIVAAWLCTGAAAAQTMNASCAPVRGAAQPNAAEMHEAEVLYLPTPHQVVEAMLRLAGVSQTDVVYDLGSGDGRIPIAAGEVGMEGLVEFRQEDLFKADLREASVVTLFLFPEMNRRLLPKLRVELRPGTRIVSHRFGLGDWAPERSIEAGGHPLLLWTVP